MNPISSLISRYVKRSAGRNPRRQNRRRPTLELLEARLVPSVYPNDPGFPQQWELHNTGQTGGLYDADMDLPAAWWRGRDGINKSALRHFFPHRQIRC